MHICAVGGLADALIKIVSNHGISESTIADALNATKAYFALPLEQKMEVCHRPHPILLALNLHPLSLAREQEDREP